VDDLTDSSPYCFIHRPDPHVTANRALRERSFQDVDQATFHIVRIIDSMPFHSSLNAALQMLRGGRLSHKGKGRPPRIS